MTLFGSIVTPFCVTKLDRAYKEVSWMGNELIVLSDGAAGSCIDNIKTDSLWFKIPHLAWHSSWE